MYTKNYDFNVINVLKIIVQNNEGKVLIIQEPKFNKWMPLHWGLPGGKPTEKESLLETFERKSKSDIGQRLKLEGILEIEELLLEDNCFMMYIVYAKTNSDKVQGEAKTFKWVDKSDIMRMKIEEFTEYYNRKLLLDFFENKLNLVPFKTIKTREYFKIRDKPDYRKWFKSGKK